MVHSESIKYKYAKTDYDLVAAFELDTIILSFSKSYGKKCGISILHRDE